MLEYLVFIAAFASLVAAFTYIRSMFRGHAKPNRVTWLMWAAAPIIASVAAVSNGVGWAALPVFMSGFSPLLIFIFSFVVKNGYWKLTTFDYGCGVLSALAIVLWLITKEPNIAIVFAIVADGLATVPTLVKAWHYPKTESVGPYIIGLFSAMTAFGAAKIWTFSEYAFPIYLIVANILLLSSIYKKRFMGLWN